MQCETVPAHSPKPSIVPRFANDVGFTTGITSDGCRLAASPKLAALGQQKTSARQRGENPVDSLGHTYFGQHVDVVPQSRVDGDQAIVFDNRLSEIMPSFLV